MDTFTRSYIETALYSSTDESRPDGGDPLDKNYTADDIAAPTLARMVADCAKFQRDKGHLFVGMRAEAGGDFWYTRNGHGCGFWDGDWADNVAPDLDTAARAYPEVNLYVGDDGKIYAMGCES